MPNIFDATLKEAVAESISGYAARFGLPTNQPARILNVDLSTLSAATDVAIGFGDPIEEIADLNFQSGPDPRLPDRGLLYNAALRFRYGVPVRTYFILLRPKADHANLTGELTYGPDGNRVEFRYGVIRLWQEPADSFLNTSLGLLPLAVLGRLPAELSSEEALHQIVRQIEARLVAEAPHDRASKLMMATALLTGMRVQPDSLARIFQGVGLMGETTAYDYFVEQGEIKRSHDLLLRQGRQRLGPLDSETETALKAITDLERLARLADAMFVVKDWQELLATP